MINVFAGGTILAKSHPHQIDTTQPPLVVSLLDGDGGGTPSPTNTTTHGCLKYNAATQTVLMYLAHNP